MRIAPGLKVEVIDGAARGAVGTVRRKWEGDWAQGVGLWLVDFDGLIRQRVLRADYLRAIPSDVEL